MSDINFRGTRVEALERVFADPMKILKRFGAFWVSRTQAAFRTKGRVGASVAGVPWPDRITPNIPAILGDLKAHRAPPRRRFDAGTPLVDTGQLRQSETWEQAGPRAIRVGTNVPYANLQQHGGEVSIPVTAEMKHFLWDWMKGLGKKAKAEMQRRIGWLFGVKVFKLRVRSRPHVLFTREDRAELDRLVNEAARGPGGA